MRASSLKAESIAFCFHVLPKSCKKSEMGAQAQAVIHDMETDVNMPFVLNLDKDGMLDLVAKTVMRKKDFKTRNQKLRV